MAVKMRLARRGRKKQPFYHIVIADARAPRDGRFIEKIGSYNPMTSPATIEIDRDRAYEWLRNGAQPTDTVRSILRFKGVLYKKHLMRGVDKGALTVEEANAKLEAWIADKEAKIQSRREKVAEERAAFLAMVSGEAPKPKAKEVEASSSDESAPKREPRKTLAEELEAKAAAEAEEATGSEAKAEVTEEAPVEEASAETEEAAPVEEAAAESTEAPAESEEAPAETASEGTEDAAEAVEEAATTEEE